MLEGADGLVCVWEAEAGGLPGILRAGTWPGAFGQVPIWRGRQCLARATGATRKPRWAIVSVAV